MAYHFKGREIIQIMSYENTEYTEKLWSDIMFAYFI